MEKNYILLRMKQINLKEWLKSLFISSTAFLLLGTTTALWENPYYIRMTEVSAWDYAILFIESLLIGLYIGVNAPPCATKKAGIGGIFGFLGFGCSICNQLLLFLLGSSFLLTWFEPVRHLVGLAGILVLSYALYQKWSSPLLQNIDITSYSGQ